MLFLFRPILSNLRLGTKLFLLNLMICATFLMVVSVILISFAIVRNMLTEVSNRDMGKVTANSRTAREITKVFADIDLLTRTFYGKDAFLKSEGGRLVLVVNNIAAGTADPILKKSLRALSDHLDSFLSQCTAVNMVLHDIEFIDHEIHAELALLENLIGELLLKFTLEGNDPSFAEQLLALVIGYRESMLQIGKLYAELGLKHNCIPLEGKTSPLIIAINDLMLRLRTVTASIPEIARHGEKILNNVQKYKEAVLNYYEAIEKFDLRMKGLEHSKRLSLTAMDDIDKTIYRTAQLTSGKIEKIIFISGAVVLILSIIVIILLGLATANLIRANINNPMKAILNGVDLFGKGIFTTPIELNRQDEWGAIAKALNDMADNLLKFYSALQESEERFRDLAELLPQPVFESDSEGNLTYSNRRGFEVFDYTKDDLENGVNVLRLYIPEDRERAGRNIQKTLLGEEFEGNEYIGLKRNGSTFPILQYDAPIIRENKAVGVRGIIIDNTERKQLLEDLKRNIEELRHTQAQLVQSEKMTAVGQLSAGVAHELNNRLTAVLIYSNMMKKKLDDFPEELGEHFGKFPKQLGLVITGANRCKTISDNLLTFARQDESEMTKVDLAEVFDKTFELINTQLRHKRIKVKRETPDKVMIHGNANQLQQVFTNVILNAAQAMEMGGEISVKIKSGDAVFDVAISDTGPGIPKENLDRIFEPFFTTKPIGEGTGLGLSIVYGIVENHDGKITVDSAPGKGTTFNFSFPTKIDTNSV